MRDDNEPNGIFMYSLVIGFLIISMAHIIPITTNNILIDYIILFFVIVVLAYIFAKVYISNIFYKVLSKLHIPYTVNRYIWYDLEEKDATYVIVKYNDKNIAYYGQLSYYEEYQRFPQITLVNYEIYTIEPWVKIEDYTDKNRKVLLDTAKVDSIEFVK